MLWRVDVRWHDQSNHGRLSNRTATSSPSRAVAAFRALLARKDLIGKPCAARLFSPLTRSPIYRSCFDRELGKGRMSPDAEIDPMRAAPVPA